MSADLGDCADGQTQWIITGYDVPPNEGEMPLISVVNSNDGCTAEASALYTVINGAGVQSTIQFTGTFNCPPAPFPNPPTRRSSLIINTGGALDLTTCANGVRVYYGNGGIREYPVSVVYGNDRIYTTECFVAGQTPVPTYTSTTGDTTGGVIAVECQ